MTAPDAVRELARSRERIEEIDRAVVGLLAERVAIAREIGRFKRVAALPTLDPAREAAVVRHAGELAREALIDDESVRQIYWHVIGMSRRAQLETG